MFTKNANYLETRETKDLVVKIGQISICSSELFTCYANRTYTVNNIVLDIVEKTSNPRVIQQPRHWLEHKPRHWLQHKPRQLVAAQTKVLVAAQTKALVAAQTKALGCSTNQGIGCSTNQGTGCSTAKALVAAQIKVLVVVSWMLLAGIPTVVHLPT